MTEQWSPETATTELNKLGKDLWLNLALSEHAERRMKEREVTTGDILHIIKTGFVYSPAEPATRGYYKYAIEGRSPNSNGRTLRLIVIPDCKARGLKRVTVMWKDGS